MNTLVFFSQQSFLARQRMCRVTITNFWLWVCHSQGHIWFDSHRIEVTSERDNEDFSLYRKHHKDEINLKAFQDTSAHSIKTLPDYRQPVSNYSAFLVTKMSKKAKRGLVCEAPPWHTMLPCSHGCVSGGWQATNESRRGFFANSLMN